MQQTSEDGEPIGSNGVVVESTPVPETAIERRPMAGEVLSLQADIDPEKLKEIARKRIDFFDSLTKLGLRRTSVHDWTDQQGKPYLQATGAEKLMPLWGIYTRDVKIVAVMNATTGFPTYEATGRVGSQLLVTEMDIVGGRNANDKFYQEQLKKTGSLDLKDVRTAAYSNWLVNAVTRIIGMRGMTWEEVSEATEGKITKETVSGRVTYPKAGTTSAKTGTTAPTTPVPAPASPAQAFIPAGNTIPPAGGDSLPTVPTPPPAPPAGSKTKPGPPYITEPQRKRLWAIAKGAGWQDTEIQNFLLREYGIEHTKEVPRKDYEKICTALESGGSH